MRKILHALLCAFSALLRTKNVWHINGQCVLYAYCYHSQKCVCEGEGIIIRKSIKLNAFLFWFFLTIIQRKYYFRGTF